MPRRPAHSRATTGSKFSRATGRPWRGPGRTGNPLDAAEIDRFEKAAERRLGEEGVAMALRGAREGVPFSVPGVGPEHRQKVAEMARGLAAARQGRDDYVVQRSREVFKQSEREQARPRQRHGPSLGR